MAQRIDNIGRRAQYRHAARSPAANDHRTGMMLLDAFILAIKNIGEAR